MVEGEGTIDDVIRSYLGHQGDPLLKTVVPHVSDVARLGQPGRAGRVDVANLVCDEIRELGEEGGGGGRWIKGSRDGE